MVFSVLESKKRNIPESLITIFKKSESYFREIIEEINRNSTMRKYFDIQTNLDRIKHDSIVIFLQVLFLSSAAKQKLILNLEFSSKSSLLKILNEIRKIFPRSMLFSEENTSNLRKLINNDSSFLLTVKNLKDYFDKTTSKISLSEVTGEFYQFFLTLSFECSKNKKILIIRKENELRRRTGSFYTPDSIVELMFQLSLRNLVKEKIDAFLYKYKKRTRFSIKRTKIPHKSLLNDLLSIKILDPCVGCGQFLLKTVDYLSGVLVRVNKWFCPDNNNISRDELRQKVITNCVYGIDVDFLALDITRFLLWFSSKGLSRDFNLSHANFLFNETWKHNFSRIFGNHVPKFDLIIGNPPWGMNIPYFHRKELKTRFNAVNDFESYQFFTLAALKSVNREGFLSYIVPNTVALNVLAQNFRKEIICKNSILHIINFSNNDIFKRDNMFLNSPIVRSLIFILKKNGKKEKCKVTTITSKQALVSSIVTREQLISSRTWAFFLNPNEHFKDLIKQVDLKSVPLGILARSKQGYIPYRTSTIQKRLYQIFPLLIFLFQPQNYEMLTRASNSADTFHQMAKKVVKNRIWHSNSKRDARFLPEIRGARVIRYGIKPPDLWVLYDQQVSTYVSLNNFTGPRLLFREILGNLPYSLQVSYATDVYIHNPSVLNAVLNVPLQYSPFYLLCILNSSLISIYVKAKFPKAAKGIDNKILIEDVRNMPIREISSSEKRPENYIMLQKLIYSVSRLLSSIGSDQKNIKDLEFLLSSTQAHIIHDFLAYLGYLRNDYEKRKLIDFSSPSSLKHRQDHVLQEKIQQIDELIDKAVYLLYDFTLEQRKIILSRIPRIK